VNPVLRQHQREDRTRSAIVGCSGGRLPDEQVVKAAALPAVQVVATARRGPVEQVVKAAALPAVQVVATARRGPVEQVVKAAALPAVQVVATARRGPVEQVVNAAALPAKQVVATARRGRAEDQQMEVLERSPNGLYRPVGVLQYRGRERSVIGEYCY